MGSLLTILTVMETLWVMDVLMRTALAVVAALCVLIFTLFWAFERLPENGE